MWIHSTDNATFECVFMSMHSGHSPKVLIKHCKNIACWNWILLNRIQCSFFTIQRFNEFDAMNEIFFTLCQIPIGFCVTFSDHAHFKCSNYSQLFWAPVKSCFIWLYPPFDCCPCSVGYPTGFGLVIVNITSHIIGGKNEFPFVIGGSLFSNADTFC